MSVDKRGLMSQIFIAMMFFCVLVGVWTVVFIKFWPWEKSNSWKPEFRLPAACAKGETCGIAYGQLADAKAEGKLTSLVPPDDVGEIGETDNWLRWKRVSGQSWQIEATASSWHFQTTVRYRVEDNVPVLDEYQEVGAKAFNYGMGLAALSLIAFYLRRLRG